MANGERDRAARRRREGVVSMYNQVFVRLLIAATITFVVIFVAASLYLLPLGQRSVGAVVPVVDDFMRAGAAGDTLAARLLLSSDALGSPGRADMDRLLGQADLFAGYDGLATESFELLPSAERGGTDMAALRATVHYTGAPSARLDAVLVLENDRWRINDLRIAPSAPSP